MKAQAIKTEFITYHYERAHGSKPRGTGHWAFSADYDSRYDAAAQNDAAAIFWAQGTYTAAKHAARAHFAAKGVSRVVVLS